MSTLSMFCKNLYYLCSYFKFSPLVMPNCAPDDQSRFKDVWPARWLSVEGLIRYDILVMMYKILHKICPESLWGKYQQRSERSAYRTRNILDLHIPRLNLEFTKRGFHYSGLKAWNDIPIDLRVISSLD